MFCPHRPVCPGCPLAELPYPAQLDQKRERLARALGRYAGLPAAPPVIGAVRTEGYRHRLKLPVARRGDRLVAGLYDPARGYVLDTPDCPVLEPGLRDALGVLLDTLDPRGDTLHAVDLRSSAATGELQVVLNCVDGELRGGAKTVRALTRRLPGLVSIAVSRTDPERKRVMGQTPRLIAGKTSITEEIGRGDTATSYQLYPGAFFQADPKNAAVLHRLVHDMVGDAAKILDLYAGVGAYARMLAPGRKRVVAVEEVPQAAEAARVGAPPNLEVRTGRVEELRNDETFDVVILNPARRGSDPASLRRIAQIAPRLVYVSCGPETLARDLDVLGSFGMRVKTIQAIDLFPQTPEVETVVLLERGVGVGPAGTGPWSHPLGWSGARGRPRQVLALVIGDPGAGGRLPGGYFERLGMVASHGLVRIELQEGGDGPRGRERHDPRGRHPGRPDRHGDPGQSDEAPVLAALGALGRQGHPVAGRDPRTSRFFAEKAGLLRPFVHVLSAAGSGAGSRPHDPRGSRGRNGPERPAFVPLHGDLAQCLLSLGFPERRLGELRGC